MAKTASIGLRIEPEIKEIAERAAEQDVRSLTSYIEIALIEKLQRDGHLKAKPKRK